MRKKSDEVHVLQEEINRLRVQVKKLKRRVVVEQKSVYSQVSSSLKELETYPIFEKRSKQQQKLTRWERTLATVRRIVFSHVGLFFILIIYTVIGGLIFQAVELETEVKRIAKESEEKGDFLTRSLNLSKKFCTDAERMNIIGSINQKTDLDDKFLADSSEALQKYHEKIGYAAKGEQWTIWGALAFCLTIYTAIGYGHITAKTTWGKVLTILYAAIGIPMYLMIMRDWGLIFSKALYAMANALQTYHRTGSFGRNQGKEDKKKLRHNEEFRVHPVVAILISFVYLLLGIFIYSPLENWDYLDTFYFLFHTFVTVGFGDLYPKDSRAFVASFIYIYVGTILIAMTITILRESVSDGLDKNAKIITARKRSRKKSNVSKTSSSGERHPSKDRQLSSNAEIHSSPNLPSSNQSRNERHRQSVEENVETQRNYEKVVHRKKVSK